jgi:hypothetical protein
MLKKNERARDAHSFCECGCARGEGVRPLNCEL